MYAMEVAGPANAAAQARRAEDVRLWNKSATAPWPGAASLLVLVILITLESRQ